MIFRDVKLESQFKMMILEGTLQKKVFKDINICWTNGNKHSQSWIGQQLLSAQTLNLLYNLYLDWEDELSDNLLRLKTWRALVQWEGNLGMSIKRYKDKLQTKPIFG